MVVFFFTVFIFTYFQILSYIFTSLPLPPHPPEKASSYPEILHRFTQTGTGHPVRLN